MSGTGWLLIFTYSAAQSMMAKMSIVALSTPDPKKCMASISGSCSSGSILFYRSSMYSAGFSTIILNHFSCSFRASNLAPKLSSFLDLWLEL